MYMECMQLVSKICYFLRFILIERVTHRKRQGEIFHPLLRSPNGINGQSWVCSEPGASESVMGVGAQELGHLSGP